MVGEMIPASGNSTSGTGLASAIGEGLGETPGDGLGDGDGDGLGETPGDGLGDGDGEGVGVGETRGWILKAKVQASLGSLFSSSSSFAGTGSGTVGATGTSLS